MIPIADQHQGASQENSPTMPERGTPSEASFIRVGTLEEVQAKGCVVVKGADRPIAVFHHGDEYTRWTTAARTWASRYTRAR
jgi:hypothetical protein